MSTLTRITPIVNPASAPAANPRDAWPDWTDEDRWEPTPDEHRPTAGPDFVPSPEDLDAAAALLNAGAAGQVVTFPRCVLDHYPPAPALREGGVR